MQSDAKLAYGVSNINNEETYDGIDLDTGRKSARVDAGHISEDSDEIFEGAETERKLNKKASLNSIKSGSVDLDGATKTTKGPRYPVEAGTPINFHMETP